MPPPSPTTKRPEMPLESSCPKCGAPNAGESRFCGNCGYRYGIGKLTQKISTMSIEDRSYAAVGSGSVMTTPIYDPSALGEEAYEMEEPMPRRGKQGQRGKGEAKVRSRDRGGGERRFPMGLMMSVMVVAALIVALAIYVISGGMPSGEKPPAGNGPVLTGVSFNTNADGSIQVRWKTDKASTSQVMFCDPAGLCSWTDKDNSYSLDHSVTMTSAKANVLYHVTVESVDQDGAKGIFESEQTFTGAKPTTTGGGDSNPPKISAVTIPGGEITDLGFVIKWTTDEPSTSQVEFGTTKSYGSFTTVDTKLRTSHVVTVYGVTPNTSYYVRVVAADIDGNTAKLEAPNAVLTQNAVAEGIQVGNRAPDFEINDLSGNAVKLSGFRGKKIVILNFWATWCGPCMAELPLFQQAKTNWSGNDHLEILAVDNIKNDSLQTVQTAISNGGYTLKVLLDANGQVSAKYSVATIPITFFIDSQGIIRNIRSTGFVNESEIENILNGIN
jgi:peroxiredoxin